MKKIKLLVRLLLPYAGIVLALMVSIYYLCGMLIDNYRDTMIAEQQTVMQIAVERFAERVESVETLSLLISNNSSVEKYAHSAMLEKEYSISQIITLQEELEKYFVNKEILDIWLYNSSTNVILSRNTAMQDASYYFKYSCVIEGQSAQEKIKSLQEAKRSVAYSLVEKISNPTNLHHANNVIEYRRRVPINLRSKHALQLIIVLNVKEFFSDFFDIAEYGSEFYVYDKDDNLLFGYGDKYEALLDLGRESDLSPVSDLEEELFGAVRFVKDDNWKIKFFWPDVVDEVGGMTLQTWLLIIIPVLAGVLLSIAFTLINYRELTDIFVLLGSHDRECNKDSEYNNDLYGYKMIKKSMLQLMDENQKYRDSISNMYLNRRYQIWDKLVRRAFENREEIVGALEEIDFERWQWNVIVLCIRYEGASYRRIIHENEMIKELVQRVLPEIVEREIEIFESRARETVCILFVKEGEDVEALLREIISRLNVEIFYPYDISVKMGAGNVASSIYDVADSYEQALKVIKYKETKESDVLLYAELGDFRNSCYYPKETNGVLGSYVASGNGESAKEILRTIYKENMKKEFNLSDEAVQTLRQYLQNSMKSVAEKCRSSWEDILMQISAAADIEECFSVSYHFIDRLVEEIRIKKENNQNQLAGQVVEYINSHYSESTLSLKQLSREFGFQENYMSKLFKDIYGENLSVIIERVRLEKACELLKCTDMMISAIAESVGYNSDISFRRVFKKAMNMTPGEYREQYGEKRG